MSYVTRKLTASPEMLAIVNNVDDFERLPCPYCNEQMWRVDNDDYPFYERKPHGKVERTEHYHCENCGSYADIVSVYTMQDRRRVKVMQDVWEEEE